MHVCMCVYVPSVGGYVSVCDSYCLLVGVRSVLLMSCVI